MQSISIPAISRPDWRLAELRLSSIALWVSGLTLLAFVLRLVWVLYTDTIPLGGDPHWYYVVGINIAEGNGFVAARNELWELPGPGLPTAFWPPGYPFALGALFTVFGVGITTAQVLNVVLGAVTVPFVYALGREIVNRQVGLAAAALFTVFPNVIAGTPLLFPEPLFTLIFVAALSLLVSRPASCWQFVAIFGFLTGVAALTRGQGALLLPIAGLYWLTSAGWRGAIQSTAIAALVATATIAPWTVRNYVEMDAFIPISTNSGAALRVGHNPDSIGMTKWTDDDIGGGFRMEESPYRPDWEVQGYREYTDLAIEYALTHPLHEIELSALKVKHLYRSDSTVIPWLNTLGATPLEPQGVETALRYVLDVSYYALIFLAVASAPLWLRRDAKRWLLVNVLLVWTLFHVMFLGEPRYHMPLYPLFFIAAAAGAWAIYERGRSLLQARTRAP
jgi:4-amino-4-deoxy-L-arabinose transferase-like glycosyltransferase